MAGFDAKLDKLLSAHRAGHTVGLAGINGVVPRLEIDVFLQDEPMCANLFIIAMKHVQESSAEDVFSFFQIAGIHGYPKVLWNQVANKNLDRNNESGYCNHGQPSFPTWHRPYILMLEQALFVHMVEIARSYNEPYKSQYLQEVVKFRLPYWDWYRPRGGAVAFPGIVDDNFEACAPYDFSAPRIFTSPGIQVKMFPQNESETIDNPFHHFNFKTRSGQMNTDDWDTLEKNGKSHFNRLKTTRHPEKDKSNDDPVRMNKVLNELRMDSNRYLLAMIGEDYYKYYDDFATYNEDTGAGKPKKPLGSPVGQWPERVKAGENAYQNSGSLEAIHNMYHGLCGGWGGAGHDGHMGYVPIAAFDPIFWFHHNNIDRVFEVWQHVRSQETETNWFSQPEMAEAKLYPFAKNDSNQYWTSNTVRYSKYLGYTYPDLKDTPQQTRDDFLNLYRWSTPSSGSTAWGECPTDMKPIDVTQLEFFQIPELDNKKYPSLLLSDTCHLSDGLQDRLKDQKNIEIIDPEKGKFWDWYIDDSVERMALNDSFSVLYFVNSEPNKPFDDTQDLLSPHLAGITYIFATPREACANCEAQDGSRTTVSNTVAITSQLLDYVEVNQLESLDPAHVRPFLEQRLRWRVVLNNGDKVNTRMMGKTKQFRIGLSSVKHTDIPVPKVEVERHDDVIQRIIGNASPGVDIDCVGAEHMNEVQNGGQDSVSNGL